MKTRATNKVMEAAVREEDLFINGRSSPARSGAIFEDFNPTNGRLFARVARAAPADTQSAIEGAVEGAARWRELAPAKKEHILLNAATCLKDSSQAFIETLVDETGSTLAKARGEVNKCVDFLCAAAGEVRRVEGTTGPQQTGKWSLNFRLPVGVVAAITPWNVPLVLSLKKVALALATGNAVLLKPSSYSPVTGLMVGKLFHQAGVPEGVVNVITGPGNELGDILTSHPAIKAISFTGETTTGKRLAGLAASNLKKFTLELGGKNPAIVLADADLEYAAQAITFGAFHHQGQNCMSVDRVIIEQPVYQKLLEIVVEKASKLVTGDPRKPETQLGPIIHERQLKNIHGLVSESLRAGASLLLGGEPQPPFYPPTVIGDVLPGMPLFEEETFGPVAPFIKAKDVSDALALANNSRYGLAAAIFTRDLDKALALATRLEVGMVHVNDSTIYTEPNAPFGGVKESGFGREGLSGWSWETFTESKWVTFQLNRKRFPF